ncbi:MAG: MCP four helix bundle domain-containing protein, partial [Thermodesulfobacteriota bacterium]|nr:MCP four helix bundle domain-containing protein [Thermodesulfobacteriota bacterium]
MTIVRRIVGGYGIVLVMLAVVIVCVLYSFKAIRNAYSEYIDVRVKQISDANELALILNRETSHARGWFLSPNVQSLVDDLEEDYRQFEAIIGKMQNRALTEVGLGMLSDMAGLHEQYKEWQRKLIAMAQQGQAEEALALGLRKARPVGYKLTKKIDQFRARQNLLAEKRLGEVTSTANLLFKIMILVSAFAAVSSIVVAFHITRTLTKQLHESIAQLSSSSTQILATTALVVSSSEEMSTAVEET